MSFNFQPLEMWENKVLLFKWFSLWHLLNYIGISPQILVVIFIISQRKGTFDITACLSILPREVKFHVFFLYFFIFCWVKINHCVCLMQFYSLVIVNWGNQNSLKASKPFTQKFLFLQIKNKKVTVRVQSWRFLEYI